MRKISSFLIPLCFLNQACINTPVKVEPAGPELVAKAEMQPLSRDQVYGYNAALENGRNKKNKEYIFRNIASAFPDNGKKMMVKDLAIDKSQVKSVGEASPWKQRVLQDAAAIEESNNRFRVPNKAFYTVPLDEKTARTLAQSEKVKQSDESFYQMETQGKEDGFEPNNNLQSAFDLTAGEGKWLSLVTADKKNEGVQWDEDWYKVVVSPHYRQLMIDLRCQHYLGNIGLRLLNSEGQIVASSDRDGDDEFLNVLLDKGGVYYVKVDGGKQGNRYDFRHWSQFTGGGDDMVEENDLQKFAFDLNPYVGKWLSETIGEGVAADDDYYKIKIPADKTRVQIDMRYQVSRGDIDIKLVDGAGKVVASSSNIGDDEFIDFAVAASGTYFIRVFPFSNQKISNMYDLRWKLDKASRKESSQTLSKSTARLGTLQK